MTALILSDLTNRSMLVATITSARVKALTGAPEPGDVLIDTHSTSTQARISCSHSQPLRFASNGLSTLTWLMSPKDSSFTMRVPSVITCLQP
jgi:hypothetical protein